jgi:hypothetical protein
MRQPTSGMFDDPGSRRAPIAILGSDDILELLAFDDDVLDSLFVELLVARSTERVSGFWDLAHTLVAHEVAEEVVVYPVIRAAGPEGGAQARERIDEQAAVEGILLTDSPRRRCELAFLRLAVRAPRGGARPRARRRARGLPDACEGDGRGGAPGP